MKRIKFNTIMNIKAVHFFTLRSLGFSKDWIRNNSKIHNKLVEMAFNAALEL